MTVGSRQWSPVRGVLGVKVYEFAVYIDQNQMRRSRLGHTLRTEGEAFTSNRRFYHQLRSNDEVDMSIVVRASRSLPLVMMSTEYEKILKRRLLRVGGRTDDPSLPGFLEMFKHDRLPAQVQDKQNYVKRGSTMCFKRHRDGTLTTYADDHKVGVIKSKALCSALFDLYLGDEPVSLEAKTLAGNRLVNMVSDQGDKKEIIEETRPLYQSSIVSKGRLRCSSMF